VALPTHTLLELHAPPAQQASDALPHGSHDPAPNGKPPLHTSMVLLQVPPVQHG
jgi:hypothetical protein